MNATYDEGSLQPTVDTKLISMKDFRDRLSFVCADDLRKDEKGKIEKPFRINGAPVALIETFGWPPESEVELDAVEPQRCDLSYDGVFSYPCSDGDIFFSCENGGENTAVFIEEIGPDKEAIAAIAGKPRPFKNGYFWGIHFGRQIVSNATSAYEELIPEEVIREVKKILNEQSSTFRTTAQQVRQAYGPTDIDAKYREGAAVGIHFVASHLKSIIESEE